MNKMVKNGWGGGSYVTNSAYCPNLFGEKS